MMNFVVNMMGFEMKMVILMQISRCASTRISLKTGAILH